MSSTRHQLHVSAGAAPAGVPAHDVDLVSGCGSRDKTVALAGIDPDETERRRVYASAGKDPV